MSGKYVRGDRVSRRESTVSTSASHSTGVDYSRNSTVTEDSLFLHENECDAELRQRNSTAEEFDHPPADDPRFSLGFDVREHLLNMPESRLDLKELRQRAQLPCDMHLCVRFCENVGISPRSAAAVSIMRLVRILHQAAFPHEDVLWILALTLAQVAKVGSQILRMSERERVNVCVLQAFIAHSIIEDETCPLHIWHRHLFVGYCDFLTLEDALFKLLVLQDFVLLPGSDSVRRFALLLCEPVADDYLDESRVLKKREHLLHAALPPKRLKVETSDQASTHYQPSLCGETSVASDINVLSPCTDVITNNLSASHFCPSKSTLDQHYLAPLPPPALSRPQQYDHMSSPLNVSSSDDSISSAIMTNHYL